MTESKRKFHLFNNDVFSQARKELFIPGLIIAVFLFIVFHLVMSTGDYFRNPVPKYTDFTMIAFMIISPALLLRIFCTPKKKRESDPAHYLSLPTESLLFSKVLALIILELVLSIEFSFLAYIVNFNVFADGMEFSAFRGRFLPGAYCFSAAFYTTALMMLVLSLFRAWWSRLPVFLFLLIVPTYAVNNLTHSDSFKIGLLSETILDPRLNMFYTMSNHELFKTEYPLNCIYTTLLFATIIAGVALFIFSKKKTYSSISVKTNISQKSTSKIDYKIIRHIASQKNSHLF